MARLRSSVGAILVGAAVAGTGAYGRPVDAADEKPAELVEVVARVNGHPVTRPELDRLLADPVERPRLVGELGADRGDARALERLAVRRLVHRRLLVQEALDRGLVVSDLELDRAVTAVRRPFGDLASFGAWMKAQGLDERSVFDVLRDDILAARARALLLKGIRVTPEEEQEYFDSHRDELLGEEVRLQLIFVREREQAVRLLQAAIGRREDFGRLAREQSLGGRASQGGDTGWVGVEALPAALREAVQGLEPGMATGPLPRADGFVLVRLHDRRSGPRMTLERARPEIRRRLLRAREAEVVSRWLQSRVSAASIEMVAGGT